MPDESKRTKTVSARSIAGVQRWVCGLVAVLGLGGGGVAVYETANQAGTVALLSIGAFAALFALIGAVPLRWTVGTASFDMSHTVEETAEILHEQLSSEQVAELAAELRAHRRGDVGRDSMTDRLADRLAGASQFESFAQRQMNEVARNLGWQYVQSDIESLRGSNGEIVSKRRIDGRFNTLLDHFIIVEIVTTNSTNSVFSAVRQVQELLVADSSNHAGLIAIDGPVPPKVVDYLRDNPSRVLLVNISMPQNGIARRLRALDEQLPIL